MRLSANALAHLRDLRNRLLRVALVIAVVSSALYWFKEQMLMVLTWPLHRAGALGGQLPAHGLMVTGLPELFFIYLKLCLWGGMFVGAPYALWEAWRFVAPGLYRHEKYAVAPALVAVPLLFYGGGIFAFTLVTPAAIAFFLGFQQTGGGVITDVFIQPTLTAYLSFVAGMSFAFGLAFELPVVLLALVRLGIVPLAALKRQRRLVIILIFIAAAILTPTPDPFNQCLLAIPMYVLYELALFIGTRWEKQAARRKANQTRARHA